MNGIDVYSQPSYDDAIKLYHNTSDYKESRLLKFKFREKPRDSDIVIHQIVNDLTKKRFGLPIRNLFFVYVTTTERHGRQMRAIPLGNNVRYFFHPEVSDMTIWFMSEVMERSLVEYIDSNYDVNMDAVVKSVNSSLTTSMNLRSMIEDLAVRLNGIVDKPTDMTRKILKFIIQELKDYVDGIKEVSDVKQLPIDFVNPEVMIYAPDDIYLMSTIKS